MLDLKTFLATLTDSQTRTIERLENFVNPPTQKSTESATDSANHDLFHLLHQIHQTDAQGLKDVTKNLKLTKNVRSKQHKQHKLRAGVLGITTVANCITISCLNLFRLMFQRGLKAHCLCTNNEAFNCRQRQKHR